MKGAVDLHTPRPRAKWHEDIGNVLWWRFPIVEPPYVGSPLDTSWPDYHTHWTPLPDPKSVELRAGPLRQSKT